VTKLDRHLAHSVERAMREEKETADRLAAYSDAVFAVIVTIMVLELKAPDQPAFSALWPLWPGLASQINDEVTNRLRAANEKVAVGGIFEWLRSVDHRSRNQTALAVVTNTGPARPTDRDVARLGQFQNALVG
jgi:hypothetical protein